MNRIQKNFVVAATLSLFAVLGLTGCPDESKPTQQEPAPQAQPAKVAEPAKAAEPVKEAVPATAVTPATTDNAAKPAPAPEANAPVKPAQ